MERHAPRLEPRMRRYVPFKVPDESLGNVRRVCFGRPQSVVLELARRGIDAHGEYPCGVYSSKERNGIRTDFRSLERRKPRVGSCDVSHHLGKKCDDVHRLHEHLADFQLSGAASEWREIDLKIRSELGQLLLREALHQVGHEVVLTRLTENHSIDS